MKRSLFMASMLVQGFSAGIARTQTRDSTRTQRKAPFTLAIRRASRPRAGALRRRQPRTRPKVQRHQTSCSSAAIKMVTRFKFQRRS